MSKRDIFNEEIMLIKRDEKIHHGRKSVMDFSMTCLKILEGAGKGLLDNAPAFEFEKTVTVPRYKF